MCWSVSTCFQNTANKVAESQPHRWHAEERTSDLPGGR
jgi:hypothetical protein